MELTFMLSEAAKMSRSMSRFVPDRYGHTFQFLDVQESEGERSGGKKVIERTEAVRHILAIMKKLGVRWQRTPKQLPGWRDSL